MRKIEKMKKKLTFDAILHIFQLELRHFNFSSVIWKAENILQLAGRLVVNHVTLFESTPKESEYSAQRSCSPRK